MRPRNFLKNVCYNNIGIIDDKHSALSIDSEEDLQSLSNTWICGEIKAVLEGRIKKYKAVFESPHKNSWSA